MSELPEGWTWATLEEVCSKVQDGTHFSPKQQSNSGDYKYITAKNIKVQGIDLKELTYISEEVHREIYNRCNPEKGDVLYIKDGATTGIATVNTLDEEFSLLSSVALLKPIRDCLDSRFLKWYLNSPDGYKAMTDQMTGSAITRIILQRIRTSPIPLAPLNEQRRIVAKVEKLLYRVDVAQARLAIIPGILKRFRQSVLAAACSGRLTADWRGEDKGVESASALLEKIRKVRLERASSNKEIAQIQVAFSNDSNNFNNGVELPATWAFSSIGAIGTVSNGSTPSRKVPEYWGGDIHWVSSGEVRNNIVSKTKECITEEGFNNSPVRLLPPGTVLLAMIGEGKTRGQSAILDIEATINQNIAAIDLSHGHVVPAYLWRWLQYQYETTREQGSGSGPQALNCQRVRELPIYLPPLAEQQEIIRRVEALMKTADALEARYRTAKVHVDRLAQSILARAFRGELVTTEAELARREGRDYEPASVLLERIRQERAQQQQQSAKSNSRRKQRGKEDSATKKMFAK